MSETWREVALGDVLDIARGGSPRPINKYLTDSESGVPWIRIGDVSPEGMYITKTAQRITRDGLAKTRLVHAGDFVLSNSMSFGRPYLLKIDGCVHDGWLVLQGVERTFLPEFLYYALISDSVQSQFQARAAGSGVRNLNIQSVRQVVVRVPPLAVQRRIVDLATAFERNLAALDLELEGLREAYQSFVSTTLGAGATGQDASERIWLTLPLGQVCSLITDGSHNSPKTVPEGYPYVTVRDVRDSRIDFAGAARVDASSFADMRKTGCAPKRGDVLFAKDGATMGKVALVDEDIDFVVLSSLAIVRPDITQVLPEFLFVAMGSAEFYRQAVEARSGLAIQRIVLKALRTLKVPVPPLADQLAIARTARAIGTLEDRLRAEREQLALLRTATLASLLSGELEVPESYDRLLGAVA